MSGGFFVRLWPWFTFPVDPVRIAPNAPTVHAKPHHAGARTATRLRAVVRRRARMSLARLLARARRVARSRTRRRRALVWLGVAMAAMATPLFGAYLLSRSTPTWWTRVEHATGDPVEVGVVPADWPARGAEVENAVVAQLSLVRQGQWDTDGVWRSEPWSVSISEQDASAWLATRLPRWVKNREGDDAWPPQVAQSRVAFTDGRIIAGAMLRNGGDAVQIMGVEIRPYVDEHGALRVPAMKVRIGRVSLPAGWLFGAITSRAGDFIPRETLESPTAKTVSDALRGESVLTRNAVIRLEDGRRVRVLNMCPQDGRLDLTFQTERR